MGLPCDPMVVPPGPGAGSSAIVYHVPEPSDAYQCMVTFPLFVIVNDCFAAVVPQFVANPIAWLDSAIPPLWPVPASAIAAGAGLERGAAGPPTASLGAPAA